MRKNKVIKISLSVYSRIAKDSQKTLALSNCSKTEVAE